MRLTNARRLRSSCAVYPARIPLCPMCGCRPSSIRAPILRLCVALCLLGSAAYAQNTTSLNPADKHPGVVLGADGLTVGYTGFGFQAVRSVQALAPGSGVRYFEGRRLVPVGDYGFGVGTTSVALNDGPGASDQGLSVSALGGIFSGGVYLGGFPAGLNEYYGLAVGYRGTNPVVHVIARTAPNGPGMVVLRHRLDAVVAPLHIVVFGQPVGVPEQQRINPGNDLGTAPLYFDGAQALADSVWLGDLGFVPTWNEPPALQLVGGDRVALVGGTVALSASAEMLLLGDLNGAAPDPVLQIVVQRSNVVGLDLVP